MEFKREYWFLSNMYPCTITCNTLSFTCVEAAFQACKCLERAKEFTNLNGFEAKKLGNQVPLRADWNQVKVNYMRALLKRKFTQYPGLLQQLKQIKEPIVEDNDWGDTYWGVCKGKGQNVLGKLLEEIKDTL